MKVFPFIKIEKKNYPTVIMGEDHFTGWFKKCKPYNSEKEREEDYKITLETAYSKGVRGFSMSPHLGLIKILKQFKQKHPEIVCISNHHWKSSYYVGKESLWEEKNMKKLVNFAASKVDKEMLNKYYWFKNNDHDFFSKKEINQFRLDEKEYKVQLKQFKGFCDFCLVGNLGISSLILHKRTDIIKREIELARKEGLIPLLMCEGGGLALPAAENLDVAGSWLCINQSCVFPNFEVTLETIKKSTKPITAYKILTNPEGFNLKKSISFIKNIKQIKSIVIGVDGKKQAEETFTGLRDYWQ
ncbi:hypothetical protein HOE37_01225 [Candidatus Woesearchaeota archaeon]|jgi:hypothetical protein|nr:hypothetical protein [Candidatus Woesearchaeota archaeon]MBT4336019.1 hypothetical protein [Candidatus Woesearchaeota archaeon]MBT4469002.1 hypothetical protein [Candidatus Woesearchaeota archaeon]MBT6744679.1 hypothetical protein [Candidatus Woesearchaeota archaeon]